MIKKAGGKEKHSAMLFRLNKAMVTIRKKITFPLFATGSPWTSCKEDLEND